ncbi:MAG: Mrp/NBP35 family ATP-binding protein [Armatimonadetes bacterium]|nr:Mrp/NBP35 family ATP-binding protein [Armatimonadota bacterium]
MFRKRGITEQDVLQALSRIQDPDLHRDIVSLGFVRNVKIQDAAVSLEINLTTPACPVKDQMRDQARQLVLALPGVKEVQVTMTAEVRRHPGLDKAALANVRNIIAVGSGKGGVGKSTVAVNIACGLAQAGARVGLLDADIYGPSIPIMVGTSEGLTVKNDLIIPHELHGVRCMSMGFLAPGDKPLIWRGPMATKALQEGLFRVDWGPLDYLVVDLPPGTGDVHITLVQSVSMTGAVIVTTPQDVGLMISMKTLRLFQQTKVHLLGIIENMSYYVCPHCGVREEIFGHGGARRRSEELEVPFLGEIPLDRQIRQHADAGTPIIVADPEGTSARAYRAIVEQLAAQVSIRNYTYTSAASLQITDVAR